MTTTDTVKKVPRSCDIYNEMFQTEGMDLNMTEDLDYRKLFQEEGKLEEMAKQDYKYKTPDIECLRRWIRSINFTKPGVRIWQCRLLDLERDHLLLKEAQSKVNVDFQEIKCWLNCLLEIFEREEIKEYMEYVKSRTVSADGQPLKAGSTCYVFLKEKKEIQHCTFSEATGDSFCELIEHGKFGNEISRCSMKLVYVDKQKVVALALEEFDKSIKTLRQLVREQEEGKMNFIDAQIEVKPCAETPSPQSEKH